MTLLYVYYGMRTPRKYHIELSALIAMATCVCDMTHSYGRYVSFMLNHMSDMTHSYVYHKMRTPRKYRL